MRGSALLAPALALALVGGCGRDSTPQPVSQAAERSAEPSRGSGHTDLPPQVPDRLEVELRQRTDVGDDTVLKLTPAGARYGLAHGKSRVSLRYRLPADALGPLYQVLRDQAFDRLEIEPSPEAPPSGSSLRVTLGSARYAASTLGRNAPKAEHAEAYAQCVAATQELLPQGRGPTVVHVRWDASVDEHSAALDVDVGEDFVGLHRQPGPRPDVELHLAGPRPLQVLLRHGTPVQSQTYELDAGSDHGLRVTYDAAQERVVLQILTDLPAP